MLLYIIALCWAGAGVTSLLFWWTQDYPVSVMPFSPILAVIAAVFGPFSFLIGWRIHKPIRRGSLSLLIGVHQIFWHPVTVWRAWRFLYGKRPNLRETFCILIHDFGYWGCENMDDENGQRHPYFAANIAGRLLGPKYYELCLYHSRYLSKKLGREPSKLCWADKLSMIYDPAWFYIPRAKASGELEEYLRNARQSNFIPPSATAEVWHAKLVEHLSAMSRLRAAAFRRETWIEDAAKILSKRFDSPTVSNGMLEHAERLAETFYDDASDRYSPEDAVDEELSNC